MFGKDFIFNVHNHPGENGTKGGSGYNYDINSKGQKFLKSYDRNTDGSLTESLYRSTGDVIPMYLYHSHTKGLYQYNPWKHNIQKKNWKSVSSGKRLKNIIYP